MGAIIVLADWKARRGRGVNNPPSDNQFIRNLENEWKSVPKDSQRCKVVKLAITSPYRKD